MDHTQLLDSLRHLYPDAEFLERAGTVFVMYDPDHRLTPEWRRPFVTVVPDDAHDHASNLGREGVYRLNVELSADAYRERFGPHPRAGADGLVHTGHDFTALDVVMPHPVYAPMSWACVLCPSAATVEALRPLLVEAYTRAVRRHAQEGRPGGAAGTLPG
ncbi:hypothetical protein HNQ07_002626 [Deinococcus metalli]|uniref:DUF6194 domain-containing protein n=1 Tax=Deinococcus metalli TaxID=1141878 RepID=A0A7W8KHB5_9DEIO|nr:DUF6194 family protein [Deinococcus metalli]MBB5377153.1 hypothetical protein [Deinococcus metalli]GHF48592.1 hypothetical protein GCM10017781_26220 [Deinococcus metalli]